MAETLFPGVYVEELPTHVRPIEGVSTSTAAFLGMGRSNLDPVLVTSFRDFAEAAGSDATGFLPLAVRAFFDNGGQRCYVTISSASDPIDAGLVALAQQKFSMLCCPDEHQFSDAAAKLVAYSERRKDLICILQSPQPPIPDESHNVPTRSSYAAYYYPWLVVPSLDGQTSVTMPPGGQICGAYARVDVQRGVHVAPAAVHLLGVLSLSHEISSADSDSLVSRGINVLRSVPERGIVIWSARTTSEDADFRYVNVRRLLVFMEQSIVGSLQWAVFEPNDPVLWTNVAHTVQDFLLNLWKRGALVGATAQGAFFVRCDRTTMTQEDLDSGRFVMIVGVAPIRPAEFLVLRFTGQTARTSDEAN
jgi:Bacteriophage tail sheath protein